MQFHLRSKDFQAMKAGKLDIWPWLVCQYNKNILMDLPSSMDILILIERKAEGNAFGDPRFRPS